MTLREFLDAILAFIGSESLTDEEYAALPEGLTQDYSKEVYEALKTTLQTREGVSGQLKRLKAYFISKGVDLNAPARDAASQIFIGAALS